MKRLLLAAVLLALMVGGAWAQAAEFTSESHPDTARIAITVTMVGFEFTVNTNSASDGSGSDLGAGNCDSVGTASYSWGSWSGDSVVYGSSGALYPCMRVHSVVWIENTGGITAEFAVGGTYDTLVSGTDDGAFWSQTTGSTTPDCAGLTENRYKFLFLSEVPTDANVATPACGSATWTDMPSGIPDLDIDDDNLISTLYAEDISNPGDGTWTDQHTSSAPDQAEAHFLVVVPPSVTSADPGNMDTHVFVANIIGSVKE